MDEAGDDALEELSLAEHDRRLRAHSAGGVAGPVRRLAEADDPVQEVRAPGEQASCDRQGGEQRQTGRERAHPERAARIAALIAGTISCMSPTTA